MCVQTVGADRRFCSGDPDIFVSTDFMPNYTSLIFSVPKNKSGLFKKTQPKDETALSMSAWFGDFSKERDEYVELPDAACHVDFYLTDPYGGQGGCTIEMFVEDSEKDCSPIIKEFDTADGSYAAAVRFIGTQSIAEALSNSDKCRIKLLYPQQGKIR